MPSSYKPPFMQRQNDKSPHILNASSNLLGIWFILLTSLKLLKQGDETMIDEITLGAIIQFMTSCICSFLSLRKPDNVGQRLETIAGYMFILALVLLFATTLLFSFDFIR